MVTTRATAKPSTVKESPSSSSPSSSKKSRRRQRFNYPLPDELSRDILLRLDRKRLCATALLCRPVARVAQDILFRQTTLTFVSCRGSRGAQAGLEAVLLKGDEGKLQGLRRGLAAKVVDSLTVAFLPSPPQRQAFKPEMGAKVVISDVLQDCGVLRELHLPTDPRSSSACFRTLLTIPPISTLTTLSLCPSALTPAAFEFLVARCAPTVTHLTLVTHDHWSSPFDFSSFSSLESFSLEMRGLPWGPSALTKYIRGCDFPERCPRLASALFSMSGTIWRKRTDMGDKPAQHFASSLVDDSRMTTAVTVRMEGWELLVSRREGKEWVWTETNLKQE